MAKGWKKLDDILWFYLSTNTMDFESFTLNDASFVNQYFLSL